MLKAELDDIRSGQGHRDLAADLNRLSTLARTHGDAVRHDTLNFRAGDADRADEIAERIFDELGLAPSGRSETGDMLARAWTLLRRTYDDVAATGRWLFRAEGGEALFPPLQSLARSAGSRGAPDGGGDIDEDEDEAAVEPAAPSSVPA